MIKLKLSWPAISLLRPVEIIVGLPDTLALVAPPYKCVWALHCAMKDGEFFFDALNSGSLVEKEKIAIVAPSLGNAYFINSDFEAQADFLEEIFTQLPRLLPLSRRKEDNNVIGVSMGGFGALRWALASGNFQNAAAVSGVFDCHIPDDERLRKDRRLKTLHISFKKTMRKCLLDQNERTRSEADFYRLARAATEPPRVALYCGEQDYISLNQTVWLEELLRSASIPVVARFFPGGHESGFWKVAFRIAVEDFFKKEAVDALH